MSDDPRIDFEYFCSCGKRMKGWAYSDEVIRRELELWRKDHPEHQLVSGAEYRKSRRRRR